MTDKKLTDAEVVKALECCVLYKQHCPSSCPLSDNYNCQKILFKDTLDLINRLQAENEDIKFLYENLKEEHLEIIKAIKHTKAEAYKEFAERLKMRAINRYNEFEDYQEYPYATITHIDELLKELVGDK